MPISYWSHLVAQFVGPEALTRISRWCARHPDCCLRQRLVEEPHGVRAILSVAAASVPSSLLLFLTVDASRY
jgi:hypothetical protein